MGGNNRLECGWTSMTQSRVQRPRMANSTSRSGVDSDSAAGVRLSDSCGVVCSMAFAGKGGVQHIATQMLTVAAAAAGVQVLFLALVFLHADFTVLGESCA